MKSLVFFTLFCLLTFSSQSQGSNTDKKGIYTAAIRFFFNGHSGSISVEDSTANHYIIGTNYTEIADQIKNGPPPQMDLSKMDSTWGKALRQADKIKYALRSCSLPVFATDSVEIQFIKSADSPQQDYGIRIRFSNIILLKNKAIVELGVTRDILGGNGVLYFLEKRNGKWLIISAMETWIS